MSPGVTGSVPADTDMFNQSSVTETGGRVLGCTLPMHWKSDDSASEAGPCATKSHGNSALMRGLTHQKQAGAILATSKDLGAMQV